METIANFFGTQSERNGIGFAFRDFYLLSDSVVGSSMQITQSFAMRTIVWLALIQNSCIRIPIAIASHLMSGVGFRCRLSALY